MDPTSTSTLPVEEPTAHPPRTGGELTSPMHVPDDDLLSDPLLFSDDPFPSLPDFPCLSSPPSSSSTPPPSSSNSSSSSSSTSWPPPPPAPLLDDDHDLLAGFDLLDHDLWEASTLLHDDSPPQTASPTTSDNLPNAGSDDLAAVFLDWLRSNKETISPEDLRGIKLRKSTIESAARRLGGGRDGMKQLLKLILAWVQNHHLQQRRRPREPNTAQCPSFHNNSLLPPMLYVPVTAGQLTDPNSTLHSPIYGHMLADGFPPWLPSPESPSMGAVYTDGLVDPIAPWPITALPYSPSPLQQYPIFPTQFPTPPPVPPYVGGIGVPVGPFLRQGPTEPMLRTTSSATKEARKKRMARQRRLMSLHHNRSNSYFQQQPPPPPPPPPSQQPQPHQLQSTTMASSSFSSLDSRVNNPPINDWLLWSNNTSIACTSSVQMVSPCDPNSSNKAKEGAKADEDRSTKPPQNHSKAHQNGTTDKRQGCKSEKNLKFLLQKVLKQSDVGSLGRIVLPKKEAETHLPELEARDGIPIIMEDIGTSRTWNMRYRYWPNNKSRMYLLENTGDFVKSNGLQEGDFIVIYSDVKCDKYMIRGVKVRKPGESRLVGISTDEYQE